MADTHSSPSAGADLDLRQFHGVFFEEAGEHLDLMEHMLLALDAGAPDDEGLNGIFRCAHSIKGGAAAFGFSDVAELTHEMESLLDRLRRHELPLRPPMIDVLLESADASRGLLAWHQGDAQGDAVATADLVRRIRALAEGAVPAVVAPAPVAAPPPAHAPAGERRLEISLGPLEFPELAGAVRDLFRDIPGLGTVSDLPDARPGMRSFAVRTTSSDAELLDLFAFHVAKEQVEIRAAPAPVPPSGPPRAAPPAPVDAGTIRVAVDKVDQIVDLVGELVITQAMLAQGARDLPAQARQPLLAALVALERNTRDLQASVMSIRMVPVSTVFARFPRMLHDLAGKLGKKVELVTQGGATELDRGLIEKITDPLTHLVRNSCDHGIETPAERLAAGKAEHGTLTLSAAHQGGTVVIEVRDDGRGLSRQKILAKARERGMEVPPAAPDAEVWNLIMAPGFSTAEVVTDVSGRGVGMDVVRKNIAALGGAVEIDSQEGRGMRVSVRLPLTLAIMDGMSVGVAGETYILPLSSVVESFQASGSAHHAVAPDTRLVKVRGEYLPVLPLEQVFQVPRDGAGHGSGIMVVVEAEGCRVALLVDALLGQHQVVVKNLETNYRKVADVAGATILGDGSVALILDVGALVRRGRH